MFNSKKSISLILPPSLTHCSQNSCSVFGHLAIFNKDSQRCPEKVLRAGDLRLQRHKSEVRIIWELGSSLCSALGFTLTHRRVIVRFILRWCTFVNRLLSEANSHGDIKANCPQTNGQCWRHPGHVANTNDHNHQATTCQHCCMNCVISLEIRKQWNYLCGLCNGLHVYLSKTVLILGILSSHCGTMWQFAHR